MLHCLTAFGYSGRIYVGFGDSFEEADKDLSEKIHNIGVTDADIRYISETDLQIKFVNWLPRCIQKHIVKFIVKDYYVKMAMRQLPSRVKKYSEAPYIV